MKKNISVILCAASLTIGVAFTSFAGQWKQDSIGWWYQNDDGSYQQDGWFQDVDGKYYYFNQAGYMLANTTTPDGYYVDASGAWVQNGNSASSANTGSSAQATSWTGTYHIWNGNTYTTNDGTVMGHNFCNADNNSLHIGGYFYGLGYCDKTLSFANNCTFWGVGGEQDPEKVPKQQFIEMLNRPSRMGLVLYVENDVIVKAELGS